MKTRIIQIITISVIMMVNGCAQEKTPFDDIKYGIWSVIVPVEWNHDRLGRRLDERRFNVVYYSFPSKGNLVRQWIYSGNYQDGVPQLHNAVKVSELSLVADTIKNYSDGVVIQLNNGVVLKIKGQTGKAYHFYVNNEKLGMLFRDKVRSVYPDTL